MIFPVLNRVERKTLCVEYTRLAAVVNDELERAWHAAQRGNPSPVRYLRIGPIEPGLSPNRGSMRKSQTD